MKPLLFTFFTRKTYDSLFAGVAWINDFPLFLLHNTKLSLMTNSNHFCPKGSYWYCTLSSLSLWGSTKPCFHPDHLFSCKYVIFSLRNLHKSYLNKCRIRPLRYRKPSSWQSPSYSLSSQDDYWLIIRGRRLNEWFSSPDRVLKGIPKVGEAYLQKQLHCIAALRKSRSKTSESETQVIKYC